jgi:hypothetical protein
VFINSNYGIPRGGNHRTAKSRRRRPACCGNSRVGFLVITVMKKSFSQKFREWITLDRATDLVVDIFLMIFDVLTHPILIVVRVFRWIMNLWFVERLKRMARWVVHWFADSRIQRLDKGQNIFRYYWWLWLLSPILLAVLIAPFWFWVEFKACWADPNC